MDRSPFEDVSVLRHTMERSSESRYVWHKVGDVLNQPQESFDIVERSWRPPLSYPLHLVSISMEPFLIETGFTAFAEAACHSLQLVF